MSSIYCICAKEMLALNTRPIHATYKLNDSMPTFSRMYCSKGCYLNDLIILGSSGYELISSFEFNYSEKRNRADEGNEPKRRKY